MGNLKQAETCARQYEESQRQVQAPFQCDTCVSLQSGANRVQ